ncbi:hypothetical protein MARPU_03960 [Marichromatium purpuratum 984]|uniref:Rap1a immunity protein domain-containing protein n=1 Tax=Marichromatium purpuratum 984 TaxID=765910 RepID=W0E204_MARPU|nr:hypothetical protein [Marichromatium purpuratum]AHF03126.1 hypothetical protein MARPU_03960 [Marichromatium purpuratum 984]
MHDRSRTGASGAIVLMLVLTLGSAAAWGRAPSAALWGYGVKPCGEFLMVAPGAEAPPALADSEYLHYREWLAGLISGLNLATGGDVLRGAELDAALARVQAYCEDDPRQDFFNAALRLLRALQKGQQSDS